MSFNDLQLIGPVLNALHDEGYVTATPVQQQSIPVILQQKDVLGCAQTGTGKTAAFALPLLQLLHLQTSQSKEGHRNIKALVLTPTRELAIQIGESLKAYGKYLPLKSLVIFGGVSQHIQVRSLAQGVDILVATPGRLLDLLNQRLLTLHDIKYFVLDEADRMLDMGFIHDVRRIISKLPIKRQTLFFSATLSPDVRALSASMLTQPVKVTVELSAATIDLIQQSLYYVEKHNKLQLLVRLLSDQSIRTALVFTRTKHGADKIARELKKKGLKADAIHGNKSQNARQSVLHNFRTGKIKVLVATDIAARGIDIEGISHVFNYELPNVPETYIHRIGRTGRAGASGTAISFCDYEEKIYLRDIQRLTNEQIPVVKDHAFDNPFMHSLQNPSQPASSMASRSRGGRGRRGKIFFQQRA